MTKNNYQQKSSLYPYFTVFFLFFLMVITANGLMVYYAQSSNPGLVKEDFFTAGIQYGAFLQKKKEMRELGYSADLFMSSKTVGVSHLWCVLYDSNKRLIPSEEIVVKMHLYRVSDKKYDQYYVVNGLKSDRIAHTFNFPGKWTVKFDLYHSDQLVYSGSEDVFIADS